MLFITLRLKYIYVYFFILFQLCNSSTHRLRRVLWMECVCLCVYFTFFSQLSCFERKQAQHFFFLLNHKQHYYYFFFLLCFYILNVYFILLLLFASFLARNHILVHYNGKICYLKSVNITMRLGAAHTNALKFQTNLI